MKITGLCPRVRVDTSATAAIGQAGGVLLTRTVTGTGLDRHLSAALAGWRKRLAIHDPGKIITDLALSLALGGDCLADLALLRAEPGVYGRVASDPTVSRAIAALASDAPAVLKAIDSARAAAREQALGTYWARIGAKCFRGTAFPLVGRRFVGVGLTGLESANRLGWTTRRGD